MAFPNNHYTPAEPAEGAKVLAVAGIVSFQLFDPILPVAKRHSRFATTLVAVPETAVHHHDAAPARKDDVWFPWEVFHMEAVPVAEAVQ